MSLDMVDAQVVGVLLILSVRDWPIAALEHRWRCAADFALRR